MHWLNEALGMKHVQRLSISQHLPKLLGRQLLALLSHALGFKSVKEEVHMGKKCTCEMSEYCLIHANLLPTWAALLSLGLLCWHMT